jgi:transposase
LLRHRLKLTGERARVKNRIIKYFESCNIKLASVFTDVFGYTSWLIITKIISGERDLGILTSYIHGRVKASKKEIQQALEGTIDQEDTTILKLLSVQLDNVDRLINAVEEEIKKLSKPYQKEIELLTTFPGIGNLTAIGIIAEIGIDMNQFKTHERLASWAAICPGNNESAGKNKSGRTRRGNNFLKRTLLQAAWAAVRTKGTYLQSKHKALSARMGSKKASIAICHKILVACFYVLRDKKEYKELGPDFLDQLNADRKVKYHVKRLEELGFHVNMVEKVDDNKKELVFID